ncbi:proton-translocating NADH-quinone oxidoreductase [[Synechococcus] sp. NIES-970]|uniref:NADH-quinone oxidoreductase subunit M n=1 Tax=Picosynechococcus sp. NKBG15041c TaxID=1407650 RepID=UPI000418F881|nr:NADH-quinone oxidoreductase subunit M [Picosynechococcus sp. NKBG15041c]BAW95166.1 proton-translocating NADH-quinone oxidoreductase [[Synechococcus] sp. NIES-970]
MLTLLLFLPLVGIGAIALLPRPITRIVATVFTIITLGISSGLLLNLNLQDAQMQYVEFHNWLSILGLNYNLGVDGLSLPLIVLNSLLTLVAIYSIGESNHRPKLYYSLILLINSGITGALVANNLLLFFLFYEIELIPFYLMIAIWGGEKKGYASTKFLIYTAISGLFVLAAFLGIVWLSQSPTFDFEKLTLENLSFNAKIVLLTILLIGFGIKIPLVPLHTWLPDAYVEANPAVTVLLGGVFAKLGTYGLVRFGLQLFPEVWSTVAPALAIIGTVSVMYGSLAAIAQRDLKRMVAYSSIGHMGYILVATAAGTELSILGAVAQMISHSLILALLFHLVGIIERKVGTRDLDVLNGLMNPVRGLPLTSSLLILAGMASAGIPGLVGFVAEFLVFQGSFSRFPIPTLFCIIASGLTAVYFVILLNRTCFGRLDSHSAYYPKVFASEKIPAIALTVLILFLGLQPAWLTRWIEPTTSQLSTTLPSPAIALNAPVFPDH